MTASKLLWLLPAVFLTSPAPTSAQNAMTVEALAHRLEIIEQQNADLQEQLQSLRREVETLKRGAEGPSTAARIDKLEEQVDVQAGRLGEQDQVKVEGSQRTPIRLTGMILFNMFRNTRHRGNLLDYPAIAGVNAMPPTGGATLRQSVIGLDFQTPEAVLGGQVRGSILLDLYTAAVDQSDRALQVNPSTVTRLRTGWIEARWGNRAILVGQDKVIFSQREPNSLARVWVSPLSGQGNLYGWRPQVRFEQTLQVTERQQVRGQIAVAQTIEDWPRIQQAFLSTLEAKRPALEGHVQFSHRLDEARRLEIGSGFHRSSTHVAGTSVPSRVYSLDGFFNPVSRLELTGFVFTGKNVAKSSARAVYGFSILTPAPGVIRAIPIRARGGWGQVTFLATRRLTFNVAAGVENPDDRDLLPEMMISKNQAYLVNGFYRLAPNVVFGVEVSQTLTRYKTGQRPRFNHYDLHLAYLF